MGCNICLEDAITDDQSTWSIENQACTNCGSKPRVRAMKCAVSELLAPTLDSMDLLGKAESLLIAASGIERSIIDPVIGQVTPGSLFGNYGDNHVTTDVVDLKEFDDDRFDLFSASLLFDYVPRTEDALASVSRVLRNRSVMFFHIGEGRLHPDDRPPYVKRMRTDWTAKYYPEDYEQPIVKMGRKWIENKLQSLGFTTTQHTWSELSSPKNITWWLAARND